METFCRKKKLQIFFTLQTPVDKQLSIYYTNMLYRMFVHIISELLDFDQVRTGYIF